MAASTTSGGSASSSSSSGGVEARHGQLIAKMRKAAVLVALFEDEEGKVRAYQVKILRTFRRGAPHRLLRARCERRSGSC